MVEIKSTKYQVKFAVMLIRLIVEQKFGANAVVRCAKAVPWYVLV